MTQTAGTSEDHRSAGAEDPPDSPRTDQRQPDDEVVITADDQLQDGDQLKDGEQLPDESQAAVTSGAGQFAPLFGAAEVDGFRARWIELQASFVDDPQAAVQRADQLVSEVIQALTATFARNRAELAPPEGDADTEALRQALRRYRSFVDQLLRI